MLRRKISSIENQTNPKIIIPPRSVVELIKTDAQTPLWRNRIGQRYRVGYYNPSHGLGDIWLVDDEGVYRDAITPDYLEKYFRIIKLSEEKDFFGKRRPPLKPIKRKGRR